MRKVVSGLLSFLSSVNDKQEIGSNEASQNGHQLNGLAEMLLIVCMILWEMLVIMRSVNVCVAVYFRQDMDGGNIKEGAS